MQREAAQGQAPHASGTKDSFISQPPRLVNFPTEAHIRWVGGELRLWNSRRGTPPTYNYCWPFERARHRRTPRPSVERIRRKALLPFESQKRIARYPCRVLRTTRIRMWSASPGAALKAPGPGTNLGTGTACHPTVLPTVGSYELPGSRRVLRTTRIRSYELPGSGSGAHRREQF